MSRAEQYLNLAAEVRAKADREESPIIKAEWEQLAETYVRLAEQSGAHKRVDLRSDPGHAQPRAAEKEAVRAGFAQVLSIGHCRALPFEERRAFARL